ncbi:MAG: response regulator transcription factor [Bacteroidota bacterium]|jgi:two-component system alkaline phosphatase synthesis response regulator PhoP|nr:MAG: DNA-binding response regulator [Candidatus Fluviicola riflensis]MBI3239510.1 response regulator transcription factor [Flavobacteriia bacterium]MDH4474406.1 response regulator transcription factor [Fluviicola sp.]OGS81791.1 MAG: DNA-binding response regulator [Fluviicola sp. RIFCSPHIGHO2_01_FULL_43_53]OGS88590.1 MAG: DNA-binding response regulator [Fluviicola sp. RIFCSPHIGHO2_12_FULL_43_24]
MQQNKANTILLVDDEQDILEFLQYNLEREGYKVLTASNGLEGVEMAQKHSPDLILMDVMMPRMDGIEACHMIRKELQLAQPLIAFLTSRSEDYSQVAGFEAGADDYITKPIRPRLLISKVEALLRRANRKHSETIETSKITVNRERFLVLLEGQEVQLPKKEFELIELLASRPGKVFTREQILGTVWGDETIVGERTIDVHIRKLREKLGESYIRTIKGVGYTFSE